MAGNTFGRVAGWLRSLNYDVRVRSHPVVHEIRMVDPTGRWSVLDVGSGDTGLVARLTDRRVVGVDRTFENPQAGTVVGGSALELPFADRSWDVVTCIDVLEHLLPPQRIQALSEILRVCRKVAIVAFPFGTGARKADEDMASAYVTSNLALPSWLGEHLRQPHPGADSTEAMLSSAGGSRIKSIQRSHNESLVVQRFHRFLALRSKRGYQLFSVICGLAVPLLLARPIAPKAAYRCIVTATLKPHQ